MSQTLTAQVVVSRPLNGPSVLRIWLWQLPGPARSQSGEARRLQGYYEVARPYSQEATHAGPSPEWLEGFVAAAQTLGLRSEQLRDSKAGKILGTRTGLPYRCLVSKARQLARFLTAWPSKKFSSFCNPSVGCVAAPMVPDRGVPSNGRRGKGAA